MLSDDQIIGTIVECLQQRFYEHELITVLLFCYTLLRKFAKKFYSSVVISVLRGS